MVMKLTIYGQRFGKIRPPTIGITFQPYEFGFSHSEIIK